LGGEFWREKLRATACAKDLGDAGTDGQAEEIERESWWLGTDDAAKEGCSWKEEREWECPLAKPERVAGQSLVVGDFVVSGRREVKESERRGAPARVGWGVEAKPDRAGIVGEEGLRASLARRDWSFSTVLNMRAIASFILFASSTLTKRLEFRFSISPR
jgi:hypothetical protein